MSAGSARCADMTTSAPASIAARNGDQLRARRAAPGRGSTTASSWCVSRSDAAEAREVLAAGRDARAAQAADDRRRQPGDGGRARCRTSGSRCAGWRGCRRGRRPARTRRSRPSPAARGRSPARPARRGPRRPRRRAPCCRRTASRRPARRAGRPPGRRRSAAAARPGRTPMPPAGRPRSARGPAPAIPTLRYRNSVIPAAGALASRRPIVVGQLVPVEREHQPAQRVERVAGVAHRVSP